MQLSVRKTFPLVKKVHRLSLISSFAATLCPVECTLSDFRGLETCLREATNKVQLNHIVHISFIMKILLKYVKSDCQSYLLRRKNFGSD